jgi:hypothetical protein
MNEDLTGIDPLLGPEIESEILKAEIEFVTAITDYEAEIRELKEKFKETTQEFAVKGVETKLVQKAVKQIAKDHKLTPQQSQIRQKIYENISRNPDAVARILAVFNS